MLHLLLSTPSVPPSHLHLPPNPIPPSTVTPIPPSTVTAPVRWLSRPHVPSRRLQEFICSTVYGNASRSPPSLTPSVATAGLISLTSQTLNRIDMECHPANYIEDLMSTLNYICQEALDDETATTINIEEASSRIQKVPALLREVPQNRNCYEPRLVSFGPYHHDNPKLKLGETLKTRLVQQFITNYRNTQSGKSINNFFNQDFDQVAHKARDCYANCSTDRFNEQDFKRLMFFDGCFIVYFIYCIVCNKQLNKSMKNDHIVFITMDLFLLENQLPYMVLQALVTNFLPIDSKNIFGRFMELQTRATGRTSSTSKHRSQKLPNFMNNTTTTPKCSSSLEAQKEPLHLLDLLRTRFLDTRSQSRRSQKGRRIRLDDIDNDNWQSFRSVQELKATGIKCSCTSNCCVKDVEYIHHSLYGELSLPAIVVDDSTKTKWLNLIAYEACPDFLNDCAFTSFVCFLDSLIDHAEDVKELRSKGILLNSLGSDQKVADLFNDLTIDLTPNPSAYMEVKRKIERHYKNKWSVWIAEVLQTNFRTPWTTTAFFAALVVIILTLLQTLLAGVQTYSEFRPTPK
ncbi:hypothetical protein NE237_018482 [Protea cynaroides]|uniref:Uncharacterized protein n=1 Tax=Protea cynaroides TaxID=273540 RepID=A0A9Q0K9Z4_9MAGN|nr:hypothetical protein NE237_018482 [Protea cynaroides]